MTDNNNQGPNATAAVGDDAQIATMDLDQNPFSHLTPEQLSALVNQVMASQGQNPQPTAAVGDDAQIGNMMDPGQ